LTFPSFKNYRYLLLITIILGVLVLLWGLGSLQLMSLNEGRRALAIKEMFFSHHWLLPNLNGELYLSNPPSL
jgi:4-amino-4-deoxy-L-arabinose transferase-like glycosyltransferase